MVHQREEVFVDGGEPHEPDVRDRKLGRGTGSGSHGVERECGLLVFTWNGALFGSVCDALSEVVWWRSASGVVEAGVLLVLSGAGGGELGLGIHCWLF